MPGPVVDEPLATRVWLVLRSRTNDNGEILKNSIQPESRCSFSLPPFSLSFCFSAFCLSFLSLYPSFSLTLSRDRYARARELSSPVYTSAIISRALILALFTAYNVRVTHVRSRKRTIGPQSKAHGKRLSIRIDWQRQRDIFTRAWAPNISRCARARNSSEFRDPRELSLNFTTDKWRSMMGIVFVLVLLSSLFFVLFFFFVFYLFRICFITRHVRTHSRLLRARVTAT